MLGKFNALPDEESATFNYTVIDGREYRWSDERRVSGRPAIIEYFSPKGRWKPVRNVDRSDLIWRVADRNMRMMASLRQAIGAV